MTEVWTTGIAHVAFAPRMAARAEAAGWDGMVVVDSQNLSGDPFVALALAARETSTLRLGTGVTNPATRHPGGRRGGDRQRPRRLRRAGRRSASDGATRRSPTSAWPPRRSPSSSGSSASPGPTCGARPSPFDDLRPYERAGARPVDVLGLAERPEDSRLHWLPPDLDAGAGRGGGHRAEGAAPSPARDADRTCWPSAPTPSGSRGRPASPGQAGATRVGAFVNVVAHPDPATARRSRRGRHDHLRPVLGHGRRRSGARSTRAPSRCCTRSTTPTTCAQHTRGGSPQAAKLTEDFIDRFGIVGPPEHCVGRLRELVDLGVDRFVVVGPSIDADRDEAAPPCDTFAEEVLPAVKEMSHAA